MGTLIASSILPDMTLAEAIDATCIHRVAGFTADRTTLLYWPCSLFEHHITLSLTEHSSGAASAKAGSGNLPAVFSVVIRR